MRRTGTRPLRPLALALLLAVAAAPVAHAAEPVQTPYTPYTPQKVVFDFYFDDPAKIGPALYRIRALMNPLMAEPYGYAPEELDIKVVVHGAEPVTLARKSYGRHRDVVERMRYYAALGVEFRVCALSLADCGYRPEDLHDFVLVVPSAITELAHWQLQGDARIAPRIMARHLSIEEIR